MPYDRMSFIEINRDFNEALPIIRENLPTLGMLRDPETITLVKDLLSLLAHGLTREQLAGALRNLEEGALQQFSNGLNLEILKRAAKDIEGHLEDPTAKEACWQNDIFCNYP